MCPSVCRLSIHLFTYPSIHSILSNSFPSVHSPQVLYHCSQLKSSPPPKTTKKPKMVRKMTAFPVITRPQAPHWICARTVEEESHCHLLVITMQSWHNVHLRIWSNPNILATKMVETAQTDKNQGWQQCLLKSSWRQLTVLVRASTTGSPNADTTMPVVKK